MFLGVSLVEIIGGVFENIGLALTAVLNGIINGLIEPIFAALGQADAWPPQS